MSGRAAYVGLLKLIQSFLFSDDRLTRHIDVDIYLLLRYWAYHHDLKGRGRIVILQAQTALSVIVRRSSVFSVALQLLKFLGTDVGGDMNCSSIAGGSGAYTVAEFSLAFGSTGEDFYDISLYVSVYRGPV